MNSFETNQKYIYNEEEFEVVWKKFQTQYKNTVSNISTMKITFKNICISVSSQRYNDAFNSWVEVRMNPYLRNFIQMQGFKIIIFTNDQFNSEKELIFISKKENKQQTFKPGISIQNEVEQVQSFLNLTLDDKIKQCLFNIKNKNGKYEQLKKNLENSLNQKRIIINWLAARILGQILLINNIKNNIIQKGFLFDEEIEKYEKKYKTVPLYIIALLLQRLAFKKSYNFIIKEHNIHSDISSKDINENTKIYSYKIIAKNKENKKINFYIDITIDQNNITHFYCSKISKQVSPIEIIEQIINDMNKLEQ